mgnify:FL=1|tara:strand:+ start:687 stop:1490 length:804 start_codon:yes stop_codon:yes gene_type:complete
MGKFLLIGSDGYLGSSFKKYLKRKNIVVYEYKYKNFYSNKSLEDFKGKINTIVHFAISGSLDKKKNFNNDINFAKKLFQFSKINNIRSYYISSISAFENNKSFYSKLKIKIEKQAVKYNVKIIKPGMIWHNKPKSWFGNVNFIVSLCYILMPLIGRGNHHIYMLHLNDFLEALYNICKIKKINKFTIFNKETISFKDLIKKICIKKNKFYFFVPIPIIIIYPIFKFLYLAKILSCDTYDSIQSYRFAKKHNFLGYKIINTSKSFKNY